MRIKFILLLIFSVIFNTGCGDSSGKSNDVPMNKKESNTSGNKNAPCAALSLPVFSRNINATNQWNNHVTSTLTSNSTLDQLKNSFNLAQCTQLFPGRKFLGISERRCLVKPSTPIINGTTIDFGASNPSRPTIVELMGCGSLLKEKPFIFADP